MEGLLKHASYIHYTFCRLILHHLRYVDSYNLFQLLPKIESIKHLLKLRKELIVVARKFTHESESPKSDANLRMLQLTRCCLMQN